MTAEHDTHVTSLTWLSGTRSMAVGLSSSELQIYDAHKAQLVRTMESHAERVSSLAWNGEVLSSGSRDSTIVQHDLRAPRHEVPAPPTRAH